MKPVRVQLIGNAAEEFESLDKVVGEEQAKGIQNSERQQLLKSIKQKIEILCFILEIIDHRRYDRIFGYRKK